MQDAQDQAVLILDAAEVYETPLVAEVGDFAEATQGFGGGMLEGSSFHYTY
ncbi:lasso RiPP family leader peptide-containing protein [Actinomadura gamaensis]|uniref:Lasso RiPP family leader peptide-containing protein n=1 Tax=Actinomadura gamaensis TaxID=1763541 RepID=A0ABV9U8N3_9ACTN